MIGPVNVHSILHCQTSAARSCVLECHGKLALEDHVALLCMTVSETKTGQDGRPGSLMLTEAL